MLRVNIHETFMRQWGACLPLDNIQIINTLLHSGRNKSIDHTDEKDLTVLHCTLKTGQIDIARLLIKHGASVGAKDVPIKSVQLFISTQKLVEASSVGLIT